MPSGLAALLDDVAAIAKLAAASVDDISAAAGRAGTKAAGVVIDDTAVTPRFVTGFTPDRELPLIWRITKGSLFNKLIILLPAALILSQFAPFLITPILMLGGSYLAFEGAEKLVEKFAGGGGHGGEGEAAAVEPVVLARHEREEQMASGAIRTDLILSAEIMALALNEMNFLEIWWEKAIALAIVAVGVTFGVYGAVGLIVKMDDIGLHMAESGSNFAQSVGRGLVKAMPKLLTGLAVIGTAAMLWVGGGIIVHGLEEFGVHWLPDFIHHASEATAEAVAGVGGFLGWAVEAALFAVVGIVIGLLLVPVGHKIHHMLAKDEAH